MRDKRPIGIFDSGIGGLTVADKIFRLLPNEKVIYFGDTARVPYGNKSKETVTRFSKEIVSFLLKFKVKLIIVACNTASSLSLKALQSSFSVPIVGVIRPGVEEALKSTRSGRIGVIGTEATVKSAAYKKEIKSISKDTFVAQESCPLFVPLVENKWTKNEITFQIAKRYLKTLKSKRVDTIILGCTHYPLLKTVIQKVIGEKVSLIDSSLAVARYVKDFLKKKKMLTSHGVPLPRFFSSDNTDNFEMLAKIFLKKNIKAKKIVL